jgi:hypothetical protein
MACHSVPALAATVKMLLQRRRRRYISRVEDEPELGFGQMRDFSGKLSVLFH